MRLCARYQMSKASSRPTAPLDAPPKAPSAAGAHGQPAPAPRAVTMADIAARVGVSKMTVSRALNRAAAAAARSTSEALRQRILQTCQDMGYVRRPDRPHVFHQAVGLRGGAGARR
jgi:hypothetical protein